MLKKQEDLDLLLIHLNKKIDVRNMTKLVYSQQSFYISYHLSNKVGLKLNQVFCFLLRH